MNYAESPENPLNMNTRGIEEWVKKYKEQERKAYHLISRPLPALATEAYARDVVNGVQIACKEVKRACERFLRDLERSRTDPDFMWRFDEAKAWRPIRFIEKKVAPSKGTIRRLVLQPWQHFVVGNLFGWVHKETGLRRFREALIFMGRKNGRVLPL